MQPQRGQSLSKGTDDYLPDSGIGSACFTIGARLERIVFGVTFGGGTGFGAMATHLPIARAWFRPHVLGALLMSNLYHNAIDPNVLEILQRA